MSGMCDVCGLPKEVCVCEEIAREQQALQIFTVTRRYGKLMTIVDGFTSEIDADQLTSDLKSACACGGTMKDGKIELQGDHKGKVKDTLAKMGFNAEVR